MLILSSIRKSWSQYWTPWTAGCCTSNCFPFGTASMKYRRMSPAGTSFDPGYFVVSLVTVGLQIPLESIKELCRVIAIPGRGVFEQKDRQKIIFSAVEHPHEGLRLRHSVRFFQYLYPCLVCHGKAPFQEFTMEVIVYRLELLPRAENDPVGKGRPRHSVMSLICSDIGTR